MSAMWRDRNREVLGVCYPASPAQSASPKPGKDPVSNRYVWEYVHIYIYICTYMHAMTISAQRGHELEGKWRGLCGMIWRK